jgi:hypothetical protein
MWRIDGSDSDWFFRIGAYLLLVGDAVSQLLNVLVFFSTNPNESISGRSYRMRRNWFWGKMRVLIDFLLSPIQKDHCRKAHDNDLSRAAMLLKETS